MLLFLLLLISLVSLSTSFTLSRPPFSPRSSRSFLSSSDDSGENLRLDYEPETATTTQARIQALVSEHPVLLFMKGNKMFPQCGFSNTAVQILQVRRAKRYASSVAKNDWPERSS